MFKTTDAYTCTLTGQLVKGSDNIGLFTAIYQVAHYDDLQLSLDSAPKGRKYVVSVTQRVVILNHAGMNLSPQDNPREYANYPALLSMRVRLQPQDSAMVQLLGYSPHTVNSKVQTSATTSASDGTTSETSSSHTAGSSTSQANTFGTSVGAVGDAFSFSASAEVTNSTTSEKSDTSGTQSGNSSNRESSASAYMSVHDWGAYALVNPSTSSPIWAFGQEYPWDAITYRKKGPGNRDSQVELVLPHAIKSRMWDGSSLLPPSHLSTFGINFSTHAQWAVTIQDGKSEEVTLNHNIGYFGASHSVTGDGDNAQVSVYIDNDPSTLKLSGQDEISAVLDVGLLGLDPVGGAGDPAVVGFIPARFTTSPAPTAGTDAEPQKFTIFATDNTLLVRDTTSYPSPCPEGTGFSADGTSLTAALPAALAADFAGLTFTILFKVTDAVADYFLHFKHWTEKTAQTGVKLKIVVNGDQSNALTQYVNDSEAKGGESNLLSIALRNQDFASVDYSDMLTMGVNSVDVTVTPIDSGKSAAYQLRAVSVVRS